jgi:hypothetical protein
MQPVVKAPDREKSNFSQGRAGSGLTIKKGPVPKGRDLGNPARGGGVTTPTKGKFRS